MMHLNYTLLNYNSYIYKDFTIGNWLFSTNMVKYN